MRTRNVANADITLRNLKGAALVVNNLLDAREWADASGWPMEGRVLVCAPVIRSAIARHLDDKGRDLPMGSIAQQNFMGQAIETVHGWGLITDRSITGDATHAPATINSSCTT